MNWTQSQLADVSMVSETTIRNFEGGREQPQWRQMDLLQRTLEAAGIIFLADGQSIDGGPGVRLRKRDR
jgi:transcriptional regulator with XRE-family HTH domain